MPMSKPEDFAEKNVNNEICCFCSNEDGSIKTCEEIFNSGVNYFMGIQNKYDKTFVEKIVRYNMNNNCPYWKGKNESILVGDMASEEEFIEIMNSLS